MRRRAGPRWGRCMRGCRVLAGGTLAATAQTGETEGVLGRGRAPAKLLQIRQWILHASSGRDQGWCTQSTPSSDGVRASPSRFSVVERAGRRIQRAPITFRPQLPPSAFFYPISFFSLTRILEQTKKQSVHLAAQVQGRSAMTLLARAAQSVWSPASTEASLPK